MSMSHDFEKTRGRLGGMFTDTGMRKSIRSQ